MIIKNINAGWGRFELDGFVGHPSYISAVPVDILRGILQYKTYQDAVITFDEEGSYFHLVLTKDDVFIIEDRADVKVITIDRSPQDVVTLLYHAVMDQLEEWLDWLSFDERDRQMYINTIRIIKEQIIHAQKR